MCTCLSLSVPLLPFTGCLWHSASSVPSSSSSESLPINVLSSLPALAFPVQLPSGSTPEGLPGSSVYLSLCCPVPFYAASSSLISSCPPLHFPFMFFFLVFVPPVPLTPPLTVLPPHPPEILDLSDCSLQMCVGSLGGLCSASTWASVPFLSDPNPRQALHTYRMPTRTGSCPFLTLGRLHLGTPYLHPFKLYLSCICEHVHWQHFGASIHCANLANLKSGNNVWQRIFPPCVNVFHMKG